MRGIDVFCERCGARQPVDRRERDPSGSALARRLVSAVSRTADGVPEPAAELFLRLCLKCRGYSCPACWNDAEAMCQSCAPLPLPEAPPLVEAEPEPAQSPRPQAPAAPPVMPPAPVQPAAVQQLPVEPAAVPRAAVEQPSPSAQMAAASAPPAPVGIDPLRPDPVVTAPFVPPRPRPSISFEVPQAPAIANMRPAVPSQREYLPVPSDARAAPAPAGVRPCRSCQLPLSARSHFCRRCGTSQES